MSEEEKFANGDAFKSIPRFLQELINFAHFRPGLKSFTFFWDKIPGISPRSINPRINPSIFAQPPC